MPIINVDVKNKIANAEKGKYIVCGNSDYTFRFSFDDEWSGFHTKTARFIYDNQYTDVVFTGNEVQMPAVYNTLIVAVGVYAGDIHTTTPAVFGTEKAITDGHPIHQDPPEDVYLQILQLIEDGAIKGDTGEAGFSPIATVEKSGKTATISITDKNGTTTASISDGEQGEQGEQGERGENGADGFSPVAYVQKEDDESTIYITDKNGTTTAVVKDGKDGTNGTNGTNGADGFSPVCSVEKTGNTAVISITDKDGTTTASVSDGQNGQEGYSPTATCEQVGNEVVISITDKNGTTTANASASGIVEQHGVATSGWASISNKYPYTYYTTIAITQTLTANTVVELVNDNALLFAKHGFAIYQIQGQTAIIYSIGIPADTVQFTFRIGSGTVGGIAERGMHNYSTDEQIVGTWTDGKTLYEKTLVITDFSGLVQEVGTYSIVYPFSDLGLNDNYDYMQIKTGTEIRTSGTILPLNYNYANNEYVAFLIKPANSQFVYTTNKSSMSSVSKVIVVIQYTKTS